MAVSAASSSSPINPIIATAEQVALSEKAPLLTRIIALGVIFKEERLDLVAHLAGKVQDEEVAKYAKNLIKISKEEPIEISRPDFKKAINLLTKIEGKILKGVEVGESRELKQLKEMSSNYFTYTIQTEGKGAVCVTLVKNAITLLSSDNIQFDQKLKLKLAKITLVYLEGMIFTVIGNGNHIYLDTRDTWKEELKRVLSTIPKKELNLRFKVRCMIASIKKLNPGEGKAIEIGKEHAAQIVAGVAEAALSRSAGPIVNPLIELAKRVYSEMEEGWFKNLWLIQTLVPAKLITQLKELDAAIPHFKGWEESNSLSMHLTEFYWDILNNDTASEPLKSYVFNGKREKAVESISSISSENESAVSKKAKSTSSNKGKEPEASSSSDNKNAKTPPPPSLCELAHFKLAGLKNKLHIKKYHSWEIRYKAIKYLSRLEGKEEYRAQVIKTITECIKKYQHFEVARLIKECYSKSKYKKLWRDNISLEGIQEMIDSSKKKDKEIIEQIRAAQEKKDKLIKEIMKKIKGRMHSREGGEPTDKKNLGTRNFQQQLMEQQQLQQFETDKQNLLFEKERCTIQQDLLEYFKQEKEKQTKIEHLQGQSAVPPSCSGQELATSKQIGNNDVQQPH